MKALICSPINFKFGFAIAKSQKKNKKNSCFALNVGSWKTKMKNLLL